MNENQKKLDAVISKIEETISHYKDGLTTAAESINVMVYEISLEKDAWNAELKRMQDELPPADFDVEPAPPRDYCPEATNPSSGWKKE